MRIIRNYDSYKMRAAILTMTAFVFLTCFFSACREKRSHDNDPATAYVFDNWQITANTPDLTDTDSLLFLVNPASANADSAFYNGIYSSQYVENDSLRVSVIYDTIAGFRLHMKRMVAVSVNPPSLIMAARCGSDSAMMILNCSQAARQQSIYIVKERSRMDSLMRSGKRIHFAASSPGGAANPDVQTYNFFIDTKGFEKARLLSDSLNRHRPAALKSNAAPTIADDLFGVW